MAFKAPELFGDNTENKDFDFKNDGIEQSNDTVQSLNPNALTIDIISSNQSIPILWLKEYISDNTKSFLGQKYLKVKDFDNFLDSLNQMRDITFVLTPELYHKITLANMKQVFIDVGSILCLYKKQYKIKIESIMSNNMIIFKTRVPYEICTALVLILNEYCSANRCNLKVLEVDTQE